MRGGGSAKGRADAAARYARWWVGLSGAPPKRASGAALVTYNGFALSDGVTGARQRCDVRSTWRERITGSVDAVYPATKRSILGKATWTPLDRFVSMKVQTIKRALTANTISAQTEPGAVGSQTAATAEAITATIMRGRFTTAPIAPGTVGLQEFCRPGDTRHLFGIGRSYTYQLIASGAIRSTCLRQRGKRNGVRLIDVQSVRDFLRGQFDQPTDATGAQ